jgi:hypothetical protein
MFIIKVTNPRQPRELFTVVDQHQQPLQFETREQANAEAQQMRDRADSNNTGLAYAVVSASRDSQR